LQHNLFKEEVKYYVLRSIRQIILFGTRKKGKKCLIRGRSLLLCQFTRRAIKLTVVELPWDFTAINFILAFMVPNRVEVLNIVFFSNGVPASPAYWLCKQSVRWNVEQ
jgi:hypothetical protein